MKTLGLSRGVALSALAVSVFAVAACGDKDAAKTPAAPKAAMPATAAAAAPVLQIRSETKQFRDWSATCGNDGTCWAFGFAPESAAGWVRITLAPGPDAKPEILFGFWPDGASSPSRIALTIDGRAFPADAADASEAEAPMGQIRTDTRRVIDALAQGKVMIINSGSTQEVSLHGAAAALLWIDEKQGRLGTTTALIRRGDRPASTVPVAPPLPTITPAPAVDQAGFDDMNQTVPAPLRARTEVGTCLKESAAMPVVSDMVMSARLNARTELWAVPCGSGAYNVTHNWYLTGPGGRDPRPAILAGTAGPGADPVMPDNSTVNGTYDPTTRTLSSFAKGRGIGDCGSAQTWAWTGDRFVLTEESTMGECAGVPSDFWPVAWRSR